MSHISLDFETYSSVDIKCGAHKYVRSPDFEILLCAYSVDGQPVDLMDLTCAGDREVFNTAFRSMLFAPDVIIHAYNAAFEALCLARHFNLNLDAGYFSRFRCTMLHALYAGYPRGLAKVGDAMGLPQDKAKSKTGEALIKQFCTPGKPTSRNGQRTRTLPQYEPERWKLFKDYCKQDVVAEMEIDRRLAAFPVPDSEQELWVLDQIINERGFAIDAAFVNSAITVSGISTAGLTDEASHIAGINPKSNAQLTNWLEDEMGEAPENLRKETVKSKLDEEIDSEDARHMLELRLELSKTSVKKYTAMANTMCDDGRARGTLLFYGANRTGRWSGRLLQSQNLPQNHLEPLELARDLVGRQKSEYIKTIFGSLPDTLSQLVRTAIVPAPGNTFLVADFSAIEARVTAWLAGEQWVMDVFASHGKIYEATASQMFGVPIDLIVKGKPEYALRQKGKVATLALGFGGGPDALIHMGALKQGLTKNELPEIVSRWRQTNRRICDLWRKLESAAIDTVHTGSQTGVRGLLIVREGDYANGQDFLTIKLPSGRKLFYPRPFIAPDRFGKDAVHFYNVVNSNWCEKAMWGGTFTENVVQAIARDCLAVSMQRLDAAGYKIVFHVHDEVIIDAPAGADVEAVCAIMGQPIPWAPGLLLKAAGFQTDFYKKD